VIQPWKCDACGASGNCRYKQHEGVWGVVQKLSSAHRKKSPKCHDDIGIGRVHCKNLWREKELR
jgi:hypothetical protein